MAKETSSIISKISHFLTGKPQDPSRRSVRSKMFSSVGGGPLERAVRALNALGTPAETGEMWSPDDWRAHFRGSKVERVATRLASLIAYPAKVALDGLRATTLESHGKPYQVPALVVTTNPFVVPFITTLTRPLHRCAVVALMYDIYPDALEAAGMEPNFLTKTLELINRWTLKHVDGVVYLGDVMKASAETRYGSNPNTWIIANGADPAEFGQSDDALPESLRTWMKDRVLFSYAGNMGVMHDVETLQNAIPCYLDSLSDEEKSHVGFVFAATGQGVARLQNAWGTQYSDNIKFIGPQPDREWAELLTKTDVAMATMTDRAWATCAPSKAYSAIAAGCALLAVCPKNSDLAHLIESDEPIGRRVSPGEVDALVDAIRTLANRSELNKLASNIQNAAKKYHINNIAAQWKACLDEVAQKAPETWAALGYRTTKRLVDLVASGLGLLAVSPILAATALGVWHDLGLPLTFHQQRPGFNCEPFELIKFRSMKACEGPIDATQDGNRLTRFGKKIRALSLDELPTLFNVFKGDMSLVGPRPLLMQYLDRYTDEQKRRQWVVPGVTGWAQVNGRNAISWEEKFALDTFYVDHASLLMDIKILFLTAKTVLCRSGINHADSATMPEFFGSQNAVDNEN